jgi:hypothetical protein
MKRVVHLVGLSRSSWRISAEVESMPNGTGPAAGESEAGVWASSSLLVRVTSIIPQEVRRKVKIKNGMKMRRMDFLSTAKFILHEQAR